MIARGAENATKSTGAKGWYCRLRPMSGVQRIQHLARGKKLAPSCEAFSAPAPALFVGSRPEKPITGPPPMTFPYLDRPLLPLAVTLPRMLEAIETALATAGPAETRRLCHRTELIRELLTPPGRSPNPP
jgi:hypothetical protein